MIYSGLRHDIGMSLTKYLNNSNLLSTKRGLGSSVDMATEYGLDGPGSNPGVNGISRPSRPILGPTQTPVKWVSGLSRG